MNITSKKLEDNWFNIHFLETYTRSCLKTFGYFDEVLIVKKRIETLKNIVENDCLIAKDQVEEFLVLNSTFNDVKDHIKNNLVIENKSISVCIMVKNEERCIKRCIDSIISVAEEIIIIDTGSTDNTISIIEKYDTSKIKVFQKEWQDDFSEIRNYAIEMAAYEWVAFIDADEYLDEESALNLLPILNIFNNHKLIDSIVLCPIIHEANDTIHFRTGKFFRKNSGIKFFGTCHEETRINDIPDSTLLIPIKIAYLHDGYLAKVQNNKKKKNRNTQLLEEMVELEPDNPRWAYMFVRDGFSTLDTEYIEKTCLHFLLVDKDSRISVKNLQYHKFILSLLTILGRLYLRECEFEKAKIVIRILEELSPNSHDVKFLAFMERISNLKIEINSLLTEVIEYRGNHEVDEESLINTQGYHIDYVLSVLLFETGNYVQAKKYFNFLQESNFIEEIFQDPSYSTIIRMLEQVED
ncbi:glycosyltransferase [Listeria seeligeri]|nr:glycosyltransferase [Listeria seeligeri]MBC1442652.1 glycosyltransferase [Listeria seeligeri]MBC1542593.1 glycosyltransferase [Listeria seeligeri]MBC1582614.1 glycosyltransferase [Listeria seeligeri]MBC1729926.1 glycosyltransferase [Listeria seeligeri]MBC1756056.1 glycosyltransferase [Listeria seeligeri]